MFDGDDGFELEGLELILNLSFDCGRFLRNRDILHMQGLDAKEDGAVVRMVKA